MAFANDSTVRAKGDGTKIDTSKYATKVGKWNLTVDEILSEAVGSSKTPIVSKETSSTKWNKDHSQGFHLVGVKMVNSSVPADHSEGKTINATSPKNVDQAQNLQLDATKVNTLFLFYERNYYDAVFHTNGTDNGDGTISSTTAKFKS